MLKNLERQHCWLSICTMNLLESIFLVCCCSIFYMFVGIFPVYIFTFIWFLICLYIIADEFHGPDWQTRLKIIIGICEGLESIYKQFPWHLNLKPDNILFDKDMVPKIDFGLSSVIFNKELTMMEEDLIRTRPISLGST